MKELWSPGAGVVKQLPPLHHESARLSVSRPESGGPRDRNAGLRRLRNPASEIGGAEGSRTPDPKTASLVLSQLSYSPTRRLTLQAGRNDVKKGEGLGRVGAGGGIRTHTPLRARVFETREYRQFLHSGTTAKRCRSYYHRPSRSPARRRKTHRKKRFGNLLLSEKTRHVRGIVHP